MTALEFLKRHHQAPDQIDGAACLTRLAADADAGLRGEGGLPMIPAFLRGSIQAPERGVCAVMDAGGTNLRTALARFDRGQCTVEQVRTIPMPASGGEVLTADALYGRIAGELARLGSTDRVGCCFSYLVDIEHSLDGRLREWCKEIRCPEAVGRYVGRSIAGALTGNPQVAVLNDTTAAFLGGKVRMGLDGRTLVGLIMGTGVNVCYCERKIPKLDTRWEDMIVNTEAGEFDGIPLGDFERMVIDKTDDPTAARAEKQCSGAYLADMILMALKEAKAQGCIRSVPEKLDLETVSRLLAEKNSTLWALFAEEDREFVTELMELSVDRSAKIGAILCGEFVRRSAGGTANAVILAEGSLFWKMDRFPQRFGRELAKLLPEVTFRLEKAEGSCLEGAALAAFAQVTAECSCAEDVPAGA